MLYPNVTQREKGKVMVREKGQGQYKGKFNVEPNQRIAMIKKNSELGKTILEYREFLRKKKVKAWKETMPKQEQIRANEVKFQRIRQQLGIKPKMFVIHCSTKPTEATFNLRDLNQDL